ncbi:MAG: hypothetical protein U5K79_14945 [Cyclobacteriaceae bacterium]|nr:hypothetical protein [Cyclobacteriaceae bacterium]
MHFLSRLAKETKVITNQELKPVVNLICKFIATKKADKLSRDSLYNKVYQMEIKSPYIIHVGIGAGTEEIRVKPNAKIPTGNPFPGGENPAETTAKKSYPASRRKFRLLLRMRFFCAYPNHANRINLMA